MEAKPAAEGTRLFNEETWKRFNQKRRYRMLTFSVEGYDTSSPVDDIKKALTDHFSSCGKIFDVYVPTDPVDRCALINVYGEDLEEKVLELNGRDAGEGWKLVAKEVPMAPVKQCDPIFGWDIPPHRKQKPVKLT